MKEMNKSSEKKPLWLGLCWAWRAVVQARRAGGSLGDIDQCEGELLYLNPLLRGPKHLAQAVGQEKFLENSSLVQPSGAGQFLSSTSKEHRTWPSPNFGRQASGAGGWLGWDLFPELWQEKKQKVCGHWKRGWVTREGCRDAL